MANPNKVEEQSIIKEYNRRALEYPDKDAVLDAGAGKRVNAYYDYISKRWILKYLSADLNDSILEFGCGMGRLTSLLSPRVKHITGIDISAELLKLAHTVPLSNAHFYLIEQGLDAMPPSSFNKILFNWVLIHINDDVIDAYLNQLENYITSQTMCYIFEQCSTVKRTFPTHIHIHRTKDEYINIFKRHGWQCIKQVRTWRIPSYGLSLWNKYPILPTISLPLLAKIDDATLFRKPRFIQYTTEAFILKKHKF